MTRVAYCFGAALIFAAAGGGPAIAATIELLAEFDATTFDVAHDGGRVATIFGDSLCIHALTSAIHDPPKCSRLVDPSAPNPRAIVRWSPDGARLAVSGAPVGYSGAVWIFAATYADTPSPVWLGEPLGEPFPPRSGVIDWVSPTILAFGASRAFAVVDAPSRMVSNFCSFVEPPGKFRSVPGQVRLLSNNRFGDVLELRAEKGSTGPVATCNNYRRSTLLGPGRWLWPMFEGAFTSERLLFSMQTFDEGVLRWTIGAKVVSLRSETLDDPRDLPFGAPASVSPDLAHIATMRQAGNGASVVVLAAADFSTVTELSVKGPVIREGLGDAEWENISPLWSPGGRRILVKGDSGSVEVFSIEKKIVEGAITGPDSLDSYQWAGDSRIVVQTTPSKVVVYGISD